MRKAAGQGEQGFTLLELLTAVTMGGILLAIATTGVIAFGRAQEESQGAQTLLSSMRAAQAKSQAEGRTYCIRLDSTTSWSTWRYSCDPAEPTTPGNPSKVAQDGLSGSTSIVSNTLAANGLSGLAHSCPSGSLGCAFFYPRGLASSGNVVIGRSDSSSQYTITVVGITGRVFLTH